MEKSTKKKINALVGSGKTKKEAALMVLGGKVPTKKKVVKKK